MTDVAWKAIERRVAAFFGASGRTPLSGGNSGHTRSDTLSDALFIEVKQRKRHAAVKLWDEVKALAKKENKIPVVALSVKNRPGFWVMVHSSDLLAVANQRALAVRDGKPVLS